MENTKATCRPARFPKKLRIFAKQPLKKKSMKVKVTILAMAALVAACTTNKAKDGATSEDSTQTELAPTDTTGTSVAGTYQGTLPAADGPGLKTVLTIRPDSTYSLVSEAIGRKSGHFEESGIWHLRANKVLELTAPSSGDKTYYKIKDAHSMLLTDSMGTEPTGELAEAYTLTRK